MGLNRREFVVLTVSVAAGLSVASVSDVVAAESQGKWVDAARVSDYAADGVYDRFKDSGFFVIRKGGSLTALSALCTHRKCKLWTVGNNSFHCKCHGSNFDADGKVTKGPAKRDLPTLSITTSAGGHLLVRLLD